MARSGSAAPAADPGAEDALTSDQPLRDDPAELNPKKRRGAPTGNQNRLIHGAYTRERAAFFADVRAHIALGKKLVAAVRGVHAEAPPKNLPD
jgi:hypothetical protein